MIGVCMGVFHLQYDIKVKLVNTIFFFLHTHKEFNLLFIWWLLKEPVKKKGRECGKKSEIQVQSKIKGGC